MRPEDASGIQMPKGRSDDGAKKKKPTIEETARAKWKAAEYAEDPAAPVPDAGLTLPVPDPPGESTQPDRLGESTQEKSIGIVEEKLAPVVAYKNKSSGDKWTYLMMDNGKVMVSRPDGGGFNKSFAVTDAAVIKKIKDMIASGDLAEEGATE